MRKTIRNTALILVLCLGFVGASISLTNTTSSNTVIAGDEHDGGGG